MSIFTVVKMAGDLALSYSYNARSTHQAQGVLTVSNGNRPSVGQMVREATEELGGEMTYHAIKAKVRAMYGDDINGSSITCSIISGSVNQPSRIHYSENKKPRLADTPYDYLFNTGRGRVVRYQPEIHGSWEIAESADGNLVVRPVDGEGDSPVAAISDGEASDDAYGMFALEAHLRDYLAKEPSQVARP